MLEFELAVPEDLLNTQVGNPILFSLLTFPSIFSRGLSLQLLQEKFL